MPLIAIELDRAERCAPTDARPTSWQNANGLKLEPMTSRDVHGKHLPRLVLVSGKAGTPSLVLPKSRYAQGGRRGPSRVGGAAARWSLLTNRRRASASKPSWGVRSKHQVDL